MELNEYQKKALITDSFNKGVNVIEVTDIAFIAKILGLVGESGEVADKFKKILRNKHGQMDKNDKKEIIKELGDVLWYVSTLASYLETDFEEVARVNLEKLADRQKRDVIKSEGDNR